VALKPTIYKARISLSNLNINLFDLLTLTIAQHPSETLERMMIRVLAFCLNAQEGLAFTKGLSTPDEPDIVARSLDDSMTLWIDVGEPAPDRIKKATRVAKAVRVYSFNTKSDVWWQQGKAKFADLPVSVCQIRWDSAQALARLVERTMELSLTISEETAYFSSGQGDCEVSWIALQNLEVGSEYK